MSQYSTDFNIINTTRDNTSHNSDDWTYIDDASPESPHTKQSSSASSVDCDIEMYPDVPTNWLNDDVSDFNNIYGTHTWDNVVTPLLKRDTPQQPWMPYTYDGLPVRSYTDIHRQVLFISNINFMILHTFLLARLRKFISREIFPDGRVLETIPSCITIYNGYPVYSLRFYKSSEKHSSNPLIIVQIEQEMQWHLPNTYDTTYQNVKDYLLEEFSSFSTKALTEPDHLRLLYKTIVDGE